MSHLAHRKPQRTFCLAIGQYWKLEKSPLVWGFLHEVNAFVTGTGSN